MPSYRSRKTGNCSDWSKTNGCHRRFLELRQVFSYSRIACLYARRTGIACTLGRA